MLPEALPIETTPPTQLRVDVLVPGWFQPRKRFPEAEMKELAASIARHGVLQPILVRPTEGRAPFEIVAGERRWRASKMADLKLIPVVIKEMTDIEALEVAVIENNQRADLHPMEEAEGFRALLDKYGADPQDTQGHHAQQIADKISKSYTYVYNRLKLLALVPDLRDMFFDGLIQTTLAEKLARMPIHLQPKAVAELKKAAPGVIPFPTRSSIVILQKKYMLRLNAAPFSIKDGNLVEGVSACSHCPKRTGFEPDMFDDVEHADTCTDPVCYQVKVDAHNVLMKSKAKAKGLQVMEGDGARAMLKFGTTSDELNGDYVYMDRPLSNFTGTDKPIKKLLGKHLQASALFEHPKDKTLREIVLVSKAIDALRKQGLLLHDPDAHKKPDRKAGQRALVETSMATKRGDITEPGPPTVIMLHDGSKPSGQSSSRLEVPDAVDEDTGPKHPSHITDDYVASEQAWRQVAFKRVHEELQNKGFAPPSIFKRMIVMELGLTFLDDEEAWRLIAPLWGWPEAPKMPLGELLTDCIKDMDDDQLDLLASELIVIGDVFADGLAIANEWDLSQVNLMRACCAPDIEVDWLEISGRSTPELDVAADELQPPIYPTNSPPPASEETGAANQAGKPAEKKAKPNTSQGPQGAQGDERAQSDLPHWVGQMVKLKVRGAKQRIGKIDELPGLGVVQVAFESGGEAQRRVETFSLHQIEALPGQVKPEESQADGAWPFPKPKAGKA